MVSVYINILPHALVSRNESCEGSLKTSLSVCQVARATGEAKCHGSKLHKELTEIKVYWFVCLNTFKFAKSKNGLFET